MLALQRSDNEAIILSTPTGELIFVRVLRNRQGVKVFLDAPKSVSICRAELVAGMCKHGPANDCKFCKEEREKDADKHGHNQSNTSNA